MSNFLPTFNSIEFDIESNVRRDRERERVKEIFNAVRFQTLANTHTKVTQ